MITIEWLVRGNWKRNLRHTRVSLALAAQCALGKSEGHFLNLHLTSNTSHNLRPACPQSRSRKSTFQMV